MVPSHIGLSLLISRLNSCLNSLYYVLVTWQAVSSSLNYMNYETLHYIIFHTNYFSVKFYVGSL